MMRRPARLHRHQSRGQFLEEGQHLGARQPAAQCHPFARVHAMKLKETLGRVHANARNLSTDGSFLMKSSTNLIMAHHAAQGPTPTIQLEQPQKLDQ
jgi:hypothetical protein